MRSTPVLLEALEAELSPKTIVLKNDSPVRELEGLKREVTVAKGNGEPIELIENGARFVADLSEGQKTGWFYDQRDNRRFMAGLAKDANVLDVYSYSGGFGVLAAKQGAKAVTCIDRSAAALDAARQAAKLNGVDKVVSFDKAEAFEALEKLGGQHAAQVRRRDLRSAGLREEPQGPQDRRAGLSQAGAAGGAAGRARRLPVRRLVLAPGRSAGCSPTR